MSFFYTGIYYIFFIVLYYFFYFILHYFYYFIYYILICPDFLLTPLSVCYVIYVTLSLSSGLIKKSINPSFIQKEFHYSHNFQERISCNSESEPLSWSKVSLSWGHDQHLSRKLQTLALIQRQQQIEGRPVRLDLLFNILGRRETALRFTPRLRTRLSERIRTEPSNRNPENPAATPLTINTSSTLGKKFDTHDTSKPRFTFACKTHQNVMYHSLTACSTFAMLQRWSIHSFWRHTRFRKWKWLSAEYAFRFQEV